MTVRVANLDRQAPLGERVAVADTWWCRLRGLLGQPPLQHGEGLLIRPCRAVHMFGMRYPIDVVFVDRDDRVVALYNQLGPGKASRYHLRAEAAVELPGGTLARTATAVGDRLSFSSS